MKQVVDMVISPSLFPCASQNVTIIQEDEINLLKPENYTLTDKINEIVKFDKNMSFNSFKWDKLMFKNGTKIKRDLNLLIIIITRQIS